MNFHIPIFFALCIGASFAQAGEAKDLDIAIQPTFGSLKSSGLRFLNPLGSGGANKVVLEAEASKQNWTVGARRFGPVTVSGATAWFARADFTDPGKYYPPPPPIEDRTPVARLDLQIAAETGDEAKAIASSLSGLLGLDSSAILTWLDLASKIPESTKALQQEGKVGEIACRVTFEPPDASGVYRVGVRIAWSDPDKDAQKMKNAQQDGSGQPATQPRQAKE
jgi:hypothetical protein